MATDDRALVKETKALIKEVESGETAHAAWVAIQDRVKRLYKTRTEREVAGLLGKASSWVHDVLVWDGGIDLPFSASARGRDQDRNTRGAKTALRDPEARKQVIASLDADEIEAVIDDANDAAIQRLHAKRSEHQTEPTAGELMGGDKFDPAEYWADTLIIRVNRNARELAKLIADGGGLLFGTMPPEEAFDYLHEAERLIAEARAAAQEQVRDKTEVV